LVVVEVELPISTFFNVIGAPDTTAAVGSVTTPAMSPVVEVCAPTLTDAINTTNSNIKCVCAKVLNRCCRSQPFIFVLHFFWRLILLQLDENVSGPVVFPTLREIVFSDVQSVSDYTSPTNASW
jgi:hypothetical protein